MYIITLKLLTLINFQFIMFLQEFSYNYEQYEQYDKNSQ